MEGKTRRMISRRGVVLIAGAAAYLGAWRWWLTRPDPTVYESIPGLPGWRMVVSGAVTSTGGTAVDAVFAGLDSDPAEQKMSPDALCQFLYTKPTDKLGATYFSDRNCPNCRSLEAKVHARADRLEIERRELPLLGPTSEAFARAMLAVALQPGGTDFQPRLFALQRGPRLAPAVMREAAAAGLDPQKLKADMYGGPVEAALRASRRATETLGIWGTPALTVGSTLLVGDVPAALLDEVISDEEGRKRAC